MIVVTQCFIEEFEEALHVFGDVKISSVVPHGDGIVVNYVHSYTSTLENKIHQEYRVAGAVVDSKGRFRIRFNMMI